MTPFHTLFPSNLSQACNKTKEIQTWQIVFSLIRHTIVSYLSALLKSAKCMSDVRDVAIFQATCLVLLRRYETRCTRHCEGYILFWPVSVIF